MGKMRVAFDCDGTLISVTGELRDDMCRLLISFVQSNQVDVIVWSGGGKNYAEGVWNRIVNQYNLHDSIPQCIENVQCLMKDKSKPDLTFDDQHVTLGTVNICVAEKEEVH